MRIAFDPHPDKLGHDIRNKLTAALGAAGLLEHSLEEDGDPQQQRIIAVLVRSLQEAAALSRYI